MKFYDLLKVIENLENDDIRQTAASELEKNINYIISLDNYIKIH